MSDTRPHAPLVSWLGGLVFVLSLGYFAWSYFFRFGHPAPASGPRRHAVLVNVLLFTAFALHHSVLARSGVKRRLGTLIPPHLERSLYVWVASILFVIVCAAWQQVPGVLYQQQGPLRIAHWSVVAIGIWLTFRSAGVIDPLDLAGIRQASGDTKAPEFRVIGPYHYVRHPIYLGWLLMVFGVPDMTLTRLMFAAISSAYLVLAIPIEERSLVESFGAEYREYQRQVRSRLIPGIW